MIYLVGCNHGIQPHDEDALFGDSEEVKGQKAHFVRLVQRIVQERRVHFIGEEWGLPESSIAQRVADEVRIAWTNINTSLEDLDRMGIPRDYVHGEYGQDAKDRWNRQREEFMYARIAANRGAAENLLIVCGFRHIGPLHALLGHINDEIEMVDYRELGWYRAGVFYEDD